MIDSCYCERKTFAELLEIAKAQQLNLKQLAAQEGCGTHCEWCIAYLRVALRSGQTRFSELLDKESLDDSLLEKTSLD